MPRKDKEGGDATRAGCAEDVTAAAPASDEATGGERASLEAVVATLTRAVEALAVGQRAAIEQAAAASTTAASSSIDYDAMRAFVADRLAAGSLGIRDATEARFLAVLGRHEERLDEADLAFYRERLRTLAVALRHGWGIAIANSPRLRGEGDGNWGLDLVVPQPAPASSAVPRSVPGAPRSDLRGRTRGNPGRRRPFQAGRVDSRAFPRGRTVGVEKTSSA